MTRKKPVILLLLLIIASCLGYIGLQSISPAIEVSSQTDTGNLPKPDITAGSQARNGTAGSPASGIPGSNRPNPSSARPEVSGDTGSSAEIRNIINTSESIYTYDEMISDIGDLEINFPDKLKVSSIGKSVTGRDIPVLILGNPEASKNILVHGSMHAREYMTTQLIMKQIEYYLRNYGKGSYEGIVFSDVFETVAVYYIPMVNPDGVSLSQQGTGWITDSALKSKVVSMNGGKQDFSEWKANINGVDLNLNFNARWQDTGGVQTAGPMNYKGPKPESEPESRAIADFTRKHDFDLTVSYHAKGSVIFWYFFQDRTHYRRDKLAAEKLAGLTGYSLVSPWKSRNSSGGYKDWFVQDFKKPGFTVEIGPPESTCPLDISYFPDIWEKNRMTTAMLAHYLITVAE